MRIRILRTAFLYALLLTQVPSTANAQVPPPAPSPPTLWSFLGIPQAYYKIRGATANRRGNLPGLEPKPPLKSIADPANLKSPWEAIKVAAEVKQAEDLAPQKIKGIKYLAKIGCGCYDGEDKKVTKAMLAGLSDCTEDVRAATVEAIADVAEDEECAKCGQRSCCKKEIILKLAEMAYERDDYGCYKEPSEEVREAAAEALQICCPSQIPVEVLEEDGQQQEREPVEAEKPGQQREPVDSSSTPADDPAPQLPQQGGPDSPEATDGAAPSGMGATGRAKALISDAAVQWPAEVGPAREGADSGMRLSNFIFTGTNSAGDARREPIQSETPASSGIQRAPTETVTPSSEVKYHLHQIRGVVDEADLANGFVTIRMPYAEVVPMGTILNVYHRYLLGESLVAQIEVVHTSRGTVSARSLNRGPLRHVFRGDRVAVSK